MTWRLKNVKLADVALIRPGFPFRSKVEREADARFAVIQPRDLGDDGHVHLQGAAGLRSLPATPKDGFLRAGDVLIQPRGTRFPAALFEPAEHPAVAAAPIYTLRADRSQVLPEFLVAVLMSPATQVIFRQSAIGTYVPQVPRRAIENLQIELPDLPSQIKLADLARLEQREREVMNRLRDARARFFDLAVKEVAKKARKRANASGPEPVPSVCQHR
jgi:hypothetical protein